MQHLPRSKLLEHHGGRHVVSEPDIRIQVLPVRLRPGTGEELFDRYHGELLAHCLDGACIVRTETEAVELSRGDQVLLVDGAPFKIDRTDGQEGVVQLIWTPGNNPCRFCWELNGRFFDLGND